MAREDLQIRDMKVLHLLASSRSPLTTTDISSRLDLPMRTVQRIVNAIELAGFPMKRDSAGMGGGIKLIGELALKISLPSNLVEMSALSVAREKMRETTAGTMLGEAMEQFVDRTLAQLTSEQRALSERYGRFYRTKGAAPAPAANPIATLVHKAMDTSQVLIIEYVSPNEHRPKRREVEPAGIWVTDARTYVFGRDRAKNAVRTFAIDRIRGAALSNEKFAPGMIDADSYFKDALGAFVGDGAVDIELTLNAEATRRLGKKLPSKTARLVHRPDGGSTMHVDAPLSDELLSWMVQLGSGVAVKSPAKAIEFVREAWRARFEAQPAKARKSVKSAPKKKPIALPGPLLRKMKKRS